MNVPWVKEWDETIHYGASKAYLLSKIDPLLTIYTKGDLS